MLVNSGQEMGAADQPNNNEGWGRVLLNDALYFQGETRELHVEDDNIGLATGEQVSFQYEVDSSAEPLEVTLVWTDYPGTPGSESGAGQRSQPHGAVPERGHVPGERVQRRSVDDRRIRRHPERRGERPAHQPRGRRLDDHGAGAERAAGRASALRPGHDRILRQLADPAGRGPGGRFRGPDLA